MEGNGLHIVEVTTVFGFVLIAMESEVVPNGYTLHQKIAEECNMVLFVLYDLLNKEWFDLEHEFDLR